jgi:hypothetical protein
VSCRPLAKTRRGWDGKIRGPYLFHFLPDSCQGCYSDRNCFLDADHLPSSLCLSPPLAECSKRPSSKAAGESKPEAYPHGYVEDFDEPRTKLAGFFSILPRYRSGICHSIGGNPASTRSRLMCEKHRHPKNFLTDNGEGWAHATTEWCDCVINACFF